jgi:SAM-dependent methyltransferase
MRTLIREFVKLCSETLPIAEPIYEFGSLQVEGQEEFADLRPLFPGKQYVGADMRKGPGVDVILNLHHIELPSESVGTILILDTLEHVEFPRKAIENAYRILKPNGALIISSVMNYPIHNYPSDYWRFTPRGFMSLINPFAFSFVDSLGDPKFPHTVVGLAFKGSVPENHTQEFEKHCEIWKQSWAETSQPTWKKLVKPFIPPIILTVYRRLERTQNTT